MTGNGSRGRVFVAVAVLALGVRAAEAEGDDVLRFYLGRSDLVVAGKLTFVWEEKMPQKGHVKYHLRVNVREVLRGDASGVKEVWAKIERFESEPSDRLPYLKTGTACILFLKKPEEDWWRGADPWFQVQPYSSAMAERLKALSPAPAGGAPTQQQ